MGRSRPHDRAVLRDDETVGDYIAFAGLVAAAVAAAVVSPLAAIVAAVLLATGQPRRWFTVAAAAFAAVGLAALRMWLTGPDAAIRWHVAWHHAVRLHTADRGWADVATDPNVWLSMLGRHWWFAPAAGLLAAGIIRVCNAALDGDREKAEPARKTVDLRRRVKAPAVTPIRRRATAGGWISGDLTSWKHGRSAVIPDSVWSRHIGIIGQPDSGKTETLVTVSALAARRGADVHVLDCKPSETLPRRFLAAMMAADDIDLSALRVWPAESYDAWRGDGDAIANRLLSCLAFTEPYFEDVAAELTFDACRAGKPPRSADEFLQRVADTSRGRRGLAASHADTALSRYRALFAAVRVDEGFGGTDRQRHRRAGSTRFDGGWAFEDAHGSIATVAGLGADRQARTAGRLLLRDFEHYAVNRSAGDRPIVLAVDELGFLGADAVVNLIERVREAGVCVVWTAQSEAGLGDAAPAVLDATGTMFLHRTSNPERIARLGGTFADVKHTRSVGRDERFTGAGTVTEAHRYRVDLNYVRGLPRGRVYAITGGQAALIDVRRVDTSAHLEAVARGEIARRAGTGVIDVEPEPDPVEPDVSNVDDDRDAAIPHL